jgi:hypothetical protein
MRSAIVCGHRGFGSGVRYDRVKLVSGGSRRRLSWERSAIEHRQYKNQSVKGSLMLSSLAPIGAKLSAQCWLPLLARVARDYVTMEGIYYSVTNK